MEFTQQTGGVNLAQNMRLAQKDRTEVLKLLAVIVFVIDIALGTFLLYTHVIAHSLGSIALIGIAFLALIVMFIRLLRSF